MGITRLFTAAAGLGCLLLAGCETGGTPAGQTTTPPPATSATGDQASGQGPCPVGTWRLATIQTSTPVEGGELKLSGGGSLTLTMNSDNTWKLTDDGSQPLSAQVSSSGVSVNGTVTIRGSADGKYAKVGEQYAFQLESSRGTADLRSDVINHTYDMDEVTNALVPSGQAALTCSGTTLRINSGSFDMTWNNVGGAGTGTAAPAPTTEGTAGTNPPAPGGELVVTTAGTHNCAGKNIKINGSALNVNLTGNCPTVEINGSTNNVDIASAGSVLVNGSANNVDAMLVAKIDVRGSRNAIKWGASPSGGEPAVSSTGVGNQIQQG